MKLLSGWKTAGIIFVFCVATTIAAPGQNFTTLVNFNNTNGATPTDPLVQGRDGNYYGTTVGYFPNSGPIDWGTVFKITAEGKLTTLHLFQLSDGGGPAGVVLATNGNFYGGTYYGGDLTCNPPYGCGTIFEMTPAGKVTTLHKFSRSDGWIIIRPLIQAIDGDFYGTTNAGGDLTCNPPYGCGTVFKITADGTFTTLHNFDGNDGEYPDARLLQASSGEFYGTTPDGGDGTGGCPNTDGCGAIFEMSPQGTVTRLYAFCTLQNCTDGYAPNAGLVQGLNGDFYGTTTAGGALDAYGGTIYDITAGGALTTLFTLCYGSDCPSGGSPSADLVLATDGNFYGVNGGGTPYQDGTLFKITPKGAYTRLHVFVGTDGANPSGGLLQATNGNFYGTTYTLGTGGGCGGGGCGTVFSLSMGLGPFVSFVSDSGAEGQTVQILGQGFTGATQVWFNGIAADFTVQSDTYLTAIVPAKATTGCVTVVTPGGTLMSNRKFLVTP